MKFNFKFNLKREIRIVAALLVVIGIIAFTEGRQDELVVGDVRVRMDNVNGNHFLDEQDIVTLMDFDQVAMKGARFSEVNMREVERKIKRQPFIQDAQLYSDLKGNIIVRASLRRPVARIVRNDGPDGYIADDGTIMPVSEKFTSRVVLVSGSYVPAMLKQKNLSTTEEGRVLMHVIETIRDDEFWSAQIAQLNIDSKMNITMLPQVGNERIEFGKPERVEQKFNKLMIFYKEILPRMGWNKYSRVNLEYEDQIVAE
ncbi:cell division protein FtsQ [Chryseolinea sp. T2]|uniref:cell division protein FtsQ/DivIB n=1 Tax=Chryseolinea sp. T2 TaxID=3129255 RepID=UPI00307730F6